MAEEIVFNYVIESFDKAKKSLEKKDYEVASLIDSVKVRLQSGWSLPLNQCGNWVRDSAIYIPGEGVYITQDSPIMKSPWRAVRAQRQRKDFYLSQRQTEKALENAVKIPKGCNLIPTDSLGGDEFTARIFGDYAKEYGNYLKNLNVMNIPLVFANPSDKPCATGIFFWSPDLLSSISGANKLSDKLPVLGIKNGGKK